ncbi:MAG: nitrate reductase associated protein [Microcystaceae cyanobacterium]
MEPYFFQFEQDFVASFRCIPMIVRMKLDTCGVKLKLTHWHQLDQTERQNLVTWPCTTPAEAEHYRQQLQALLQAKMGKPAGELPLDPQPTWLIEDHIPDSVQQKIQEFRSPLALTEWQNLEPIQRFALIKLSRANHENANFLPALTEFQLYPLE